jgi:hypothetical protein
MFAVEALFSLDGHVRHSTLEAMGLAGGHAVTTVSGAPDTEVFRTSVTRVRQRPLAPGDLVVRDHVSARQAAGMHQALARHSSTHGGDARP